MEKQFILPESILAAILRYLETRPYAEVAQGIAALMRLEELKKTEPMAPPPPDRKLTVAQKYDGGAM